MALFPKKKPKPQLPATHINGLSCDALLENLQTAIICTDDALTVTFANGAAESLFFASKSKLIGTHISKVIQDDDFNLTDMALRAKEKTQVFARRDVLLKLKYKNTLVDYSVTPLGDGKGKFSGLLFEIYTKDRQARIVREQKINQQHAVTRQLIRGVAHEVKNPLAGIRGAAQLLMRSTGDLGLSSEVGEYLDVIIQESDRLKALANAMLGSHRLPNLALTSVHEPLEHVIKLISAQHDHIAITRDYDLSIPEIQLDKHKLIQVFLNISKNAANAMREAGTPAPSLTFKTRIKLGITLGEITHRHVACISIIDNGPGIPDALKDTLFYPMVTGSAKGTGLGLSIAQDIIKQHGGMIECDSRAGRTAFYIYLPIITDEPDKTDVGKKTK